MIRAIIFDMDGTLVDSVDHHARSIQQALEEFGMIIPYDQIRFQIGKGMDQLLPVFLNEAEIMDIGARVAKRKGEIFKTSFLPQIKGFPMVRELFLKLLDEGKKVALASSAEKAEFEELKRHAHIADLLDAETSADEAAESKPKPDVFEVALKKLGSPPPDETLCIGDSPYDIEAAMKAGIRTIAVRCGGFPESALKDAIAMYNDPAELLENYALSPLVW